MKSKIYQLLLVFSLLFLAGCKKDRVDAANTKTLQSSINDMTSSLSTLKQVKFNEALYILKTFGVEAEGDINELNALGKLINGMKVPQIFAIADEVAQKNGIEWSSSGPPSLGEMNIFGNEQAKESDPNDVSANSLSITTNPVGSADVSGANSLQIVPRLVDTSGNPVDFSGAGLEAVMEVFSNGERILTSKNLMMDNNFKGFNLKFASLPSQKIIDNKIDITVSVKTTKKTFKMSKIGVDVNPKALLVKNTTESSTEIPVENSTASQEQTSPTEAPVNTPSSDPKTSVSKFLNNLNSQNLRGAYSVSENPDWGSYEAFSNPASGFGSVKNVSVKNISTNNTTSGSASVNATYDVTDKTGKTTSLQVTFGLKNVNGEWKISSYKIN